MKGGRLNPHRGSKFKEFLRKDGTLESITASALKRVRKLRLVKVVEVKPLGDHRLRIRFSDGSVHDFSELMGEGGEMVEPLKDPAFFDQVHIEYGVLTWPNGFDLDAIALHMSMEEAGELRSPATTK